MAIMIETHPRIAIVGGGPAGLTLGLLLHQRGIPFTIYELRPRPTEEEIAAPCGMLDLHEESGLAAIRACGLWEEFLALTGECEESMILIDKDANVLHSDGGGAEARPEIARNKLSGLLLSKIPAESLRHDTKLVSATRDPGSGEVTLELRSTTVEGGTTTSETFDLVVGADGAWSRVRPLLTDVRPTSTGVLLFTMNIRHVSTRFPHLSELTGKGMFLCLGNKHMLSSHRSAQDSCFIYCMTSAPGDAATMDLLSGASLPDLKQRLLGDERFYRDHAPVVKELLTRAFDEAMSSGSGSDAGVKPISMLPRDHRWEHKPFATLVGDAAHVMIPSGEGVNLAMVDALDLSRAISGAWEACDWAAGGGRRGFVEAVGPAVGEFEETMFARGHRMAEEAWGLGQVMFADDAAKGVVAMFKGLVQNGSGPSELLERLVTLSME